MFGGKKIMTHNSATNLVVHDLEPYTEYTIYVAAVHEILGIGPYSKPIVVRTKECECLCCENKCKAYT